MILRGPFRFVLSGLVVLALGGVVLLGGRTIRAREIAALERQLALAQADRNAASVREVARRIGRLDETAETRLRIAEIFLSLNLREDFWQMLRRVEKDAPEQIARIEPLRAKGYRAAGQRTECVASLQRYLRLPGLSLQEKLAALDELAEVLSELEQWSEARAALDQRLALGDAPAPRLKRAYVLTRAACWADARDEFGRLQRMAAADSEVKALLPRWERVERGLTELEACDNAVKAAPDALQARFDRAWIEARLGLWQNAVADLRQAVARAPQNRARLLGLPLLLCAKLGMKTTSQEMEMEEVTKEELAGVPWLAPSESLKQLNELLEATAHGLLFWHTVNE